MPSRPSWPSAAPRRGQSVRCLALCQPEEGPQRHGRLLAGAAGDGEAEARLVDRIVHHVRVVHGEREHPPVGERRRFDLYPREPAAQRRNARRRTACRAAIPPSPDPPRRPAPRTRPAPDPPAATAARAASPRCWHRSPPRARRTGRRRPPRCAPAPPAAVRHRRRRDDRGADRGRCRRRAAPARSLPGRSATRAVSRPVVISRSRWLSERSSRST